MDGHITECADELVASEQLISFSIVERFCEACGDLTPHHIDESTGPAIEDEEIEGPIFLPPISKHECVICREEEERDINKKEWDKY